MAVKHLSDQKFGLIFGALFGFIATLKWLVFGSNGTLVAGIASAFLAAALVRPKLLLPLNRLWENLSHCLGRVSNFIILGTFFCVVITPIGALMRLVAIDPMRRRIERGADTYFTPVRRHANSETFHDMF